MPSYRISKYDPNLRDVNGAYTQNEWTSVGDIGESFNGVVLTAATYIATENAYVETANTFLAEAGINYLKIDSLENNHGYNNSELNLANGHECQLLEIADIARLNLRSTIWCRLVAENAFLHFGWDYYMYLGVPSNCHSSIDFALHSGLFVEPFQTPY